MNRRSAFVAACAWAMAAMGLGFAGAAVAAGQPAIVTIVDGEATWLHDVQRFAVAEGVRLAAGDIVDTSPVTRLVRVEPAGGAAINLGPATRLMLSPQFSGDKARGAFDAYLLQGWSKSAAAVASPVLDVRSVGGNGSVVVWLQPDGKVQVFCESGTATLVDRRGGNATVALKAGEFFQRHGDSKGVLPRPPQAFLDAVPRPFVDTLPDRAELFKARTVTPKALGEVSYGDAQPWIDGEPSLRRSYMARWMPLARGNAEFRRALATHLNAHREWEPILFPERFRPASR